MIAQGIQIDPMIETIAAPQKTPQSAYQSTGEPFSNILKDASIARQAHTPEKSQQDTQTVPYENQEGKVVTAHNPRMAAFGLKKQLFSLKNLPESFNLEMLVGQDGKLNLELLKKLLSGKDGKLEEMVVGRDGLQALKQLLLDNGVNEKQLADLFKGLEAKAGKGGLPIKELFTKLKDMKFEVEADESPEAMDIAALPYIESVLAALGVSPGDVKTIIEGAKSEELGIDLTRLIKNLKKYIVKRRVSGQAMPQTTAAENDSQQKNLLQMFRQLGIGQELNEHSPLTLDRLVAELEKTKGLKTNKKGKVQNDVDKLKNFVADVRVDPLKKHQLTEATPATIGMPVQKNDAAKKIFAMLDQNKNAQDTVPDVKKTTAKLKKAKQVGHVKTNGTPPPTTESKAEPQIKNDPAGISMKVEGNKVKTAKEAPPVFDSILKSSSHREKVAAFANSRPTTRQLPNYVLDQVNRQVARSVLNNENEVNLQLKPPHLGRLKLTLINNAGGLRVNILAEQNSTRDMLMNHAHELKQVLMEQGIRLEKVDVQISYNFDQSMTQTKQEAWNQQGRKRRDTAMNDGQAVNERASPELTEQVPRMKNGLDLIA